MIPNTCSTEGEHIPELNDVCFKYNNSFWGGNYKTDELVKSWPLMGNPLPITLIVCTYLLMVVLGPRLMENKPAFNLNITMIFYNVLQVFISGVHCYKIVEKGIFKDGFLQAGCDYPVYTTDQFFLNGAWLYLIAKISDFQETLYFILAKKHRMVIYLQAYHHVFMVLYLWGVLKYALAGDGAVFVCLNSAAHVLISLLNLVSIFKPKIQRLNWLKNIVTTLQMTQFLLCLSYIAYTYNSPNCFFSSLFQGILSFNIVVFLSILLMFYSDMPDLQFQISLFLNNVFMIISYILQK